MIQRLHFCLLCSFVILVISSLISYREGKVESLDLRSSRALIFSNSSVGTGSVLSRCRPGGMWYDAALRMMARKIFSTFWQLVESRLSLSLSSISLLYRCQFDFFRLMLERCCIESIVTYICKLMLQTTQHTSGGAVTADSSCCANCVEPPHPQHWGPDLPFFGHAGHADPLDGWRCCSQKRVMSRPIQVRQL